jgi:hypothetical protein
VVVVSATVVGVSLLVVGATVVGVTAVVVVALEPPQAIANNARDSRRTATMTTAIARNGLGIGKPLLWSKSK